jgi:formate dehydrogenase subunit gamma
MNMHGYASLRLLLVAVLMLWGAAAWAQPAPPRAAAQAQREATQPGNNQPFWLDARAGRIGATQIENIEAGSLINPGGQVWRSLHEGPFPFWGAIWLVAVFVAILLFYFIVGAMPLHEPESGRLIRRFSAWERTVHWTVAIAFIVLAVTGLIIYFGKYYLALLLTYPIYSWVAKISASVHNFTAPVFAVSLVVMLANFHRRNRWAPHDWLWMKRGGGFISKRDPGSGFFNAGEKIWYWGAVLFLGLVMVASGLVLLFPVYNQTRNMLTAADIIHLIGAFLFIATSFGHIYIGTIGMHGAYRAMRRGVVDETWAKEHHRYWYEDLRAGRAEEASDAPLIPQGATRGVPRPAP